MADDDDWRVRRAAELIGTPFERPKPVNRVDDTLPIMNAVQVPLTTASATSSSPFRSSSPAPSTAATRSTANAVLPATKVAAPVSRVISAKSTTTSRRGILAPLVAIGLVILALIAASWAFLDRRTSAPASVRAGVPIAAPIARVAPAALPPVTAMPITPPVPHVIELQPVAPVATSTAPARIVSPHTARSTARGKTDIVKVTKPHARSPVAKIKPKPHAHRRAKPVHADATPRDSREAADLVPRPAIVKPRLPICQPHVSNRAARPCRPSVDRSVRKPFFGT